MKKELLRKDPSQEDLQGFEAKRNNYSEESDNYNLFLLVDLINYENSNNLGKKRTAENGSNPKIKRVKIGEEKEEEKIELKPEPRVINIKSWGKSKK